MKAYFFDLDGTLADSQHGLYPSFRAALAFFGVPPVPDSELAKFLGTPLPKLFRTYRPTLTDAEIEAGMQTFRAVYEKTGLEDNDLYPGVLDMLAAARNARLKTLIVTSKPESQANRAAQLLKLDQYVEAVIGASPAETDTKTDLIKRALGVANVTSDEAAMIGDRHYDVIGAIENGVLPIGALWGYGTRNELHAAGCRHFAQSPDELRTRFIETGIGFGQQSQPSAASLGR